MSEDRRFLRGRARFLLPGDETTTRLVPQADPIGLDEAWGKGSWAITAGGSIERPIDDRGTLRWSPLYPVGAEVLIADWSATPEGWFDVPVVLGPEYEGRRLITNLEGAP